jgi:hypothetical protein
MNLLCFPSENLLHDLVLPLHLRPDRVWVAAVAGSEGRAAGFAGLLASHGFDAGVIKLPAFGGCDEHPAVLMRALEGVMLDGGQRELVLALGDSAGPWELACMQLLRGLLREGEFRVVLLTDGARRQARLEPGRVQIDELPSVIGPADYLAACKATLRSSASDEAIWIERARPRRELTLHLARDCEVLGSALGTLNYLATNAVDRDGEELIQPKQHLPRAPARPLRAALEQSMAAGLVDFDGDRELIFRSAEACGYVAGGWMEEYAWLTASELGAEHVHAGLELTWNVGKGMSPRNELDLFVLHRNRALTVECKTSNMGDGDTTAKILYKLDSIADRLSRLPGNAVFLSAREVPEMIVKRASAQGVAVFDAGRLTGFRGWLGKWLTG